MTKILEDLAEVVRLFDKLPKDGKVSATMYADAVKAQIAASNFFTAHHATITDMAKRLEAAERDAVRYRWLVDNCQECPDALGMGGQLYFGTYSGVDGIDQAIDAAMQESGE